MLLVVDAIVSILTLIVPTELSILFIIVVLIVKMIKEGRYMKNNDKSVGCSNVGTQTLGYEKLIINYDIDMQLEV